METGQVLKVGVKRASSYSSGESFYARMAADGRITIPKITLGVLQMRSDDKKSLVGCVLQVTVEPAETST